MTLLEILLAIALTATTVCAVLAGYVLVWSLKEAKQRAIQERIRHRLNAYRVEDTETTFRAGFEHGYCTGYRDAATHDIPSSRLELAAKAAQELLTARQPYDTKRTKTGI